MEVSTSNALTVALLELTSVSSMPGFFNQAACAASDPKIFDDESRRIDLAEKVCARCPIRRQCLNWALENEEHGFWAGTTPQMRQSMRRSKVVDITLRTKKLDKQLVLASPLTNAEVAIKLGCSKRTVIRERKKMRQQLLAS